MTLEYIVTDLERIGDELIIFQKDELSINSEIVLLEAEDGNTIRVKDGAKYVYFLEVGTAKDFISDWLAALPSKPTAKQIALRLFEYGVNDA
ncbi:hypothetical protein [Mucilaginibacter paludis]|uniref:Uncharacterized protein n=1 Tax=Mucilaginibacter paludis DSM 18603 TaxID=714943 RepID=H1Y9U0_9SPHI|nr:hypothetical protein [Mucilaginibacter paludis]EHQ31123.1 hypothetical protein Mucpa_7080 [Mucilaginibacter paludis DSM 18603]